MPKTLLLADDSVTIQKVVGISFANEDVRIVTVDNGDDAVTRAREIRPDIVLADVVMPGKSGYDVCAALKADPALAHIPVLLLTGTFETFDEDRAARVGADGHITKPFEAQALVELVSARLASAAAPRSATPAAAAAKPAAEPEPFDFLEPEAAAPSPVRGGTARPVAADSADAFAFEAEPLEAIDLETEDDAEIDLGNEATAARTTLLLDDDEDAFAEAATAPPVRAATAPPVRAGTRAARVRSGTAPPVRAWHRPAGRRRQRRERRAGCARSRARDRGLRRLERAHPPRAADGRRRGDGRPRRSVRGRSALGHRGVRGRPLRALRRTPGMGRRRPTSSTTPSPTEALTQRVAAPAAPVHDDATPPTFTAPLFDDDAAAEFELTDDAPRRSAAAPAPVAAALRGAAPELSGAMREQVHATIEKIAWEALGDVSERIVREAVARIEQVAWEVIPRLAETLIREEIRKLKGEE